MSVVERVSSSTKLTVSSSYLKAILWWLVLRDSYVSTRISNITWLSVKKSGSLSGTKTYTGTLNFSTGIPYFWVHLPLFELKQRREQKRYCSYQGNEYVCHRHSWRSTSIHTWGVHSACGHLGTHGGCRSSCCLSKSETENNSAKEILNKNDSFFRANCPCSKKMTGHYAWPHCSFFLVIMLAIILLVVGLGALWVLVIASKMIMALIVLMTIVGLAIVAVALVALIVVAIFTTTMLLVARFMAMCNRKMSCFLFLWLLLILGNLLKNARWLVGCLTLLKDSNHLERVSRHHFVQVCKCSDVPWAARR